MKFKIIISILLFNINITTAQKYTEKYLKEARKVSEIWLNDVNNNNFSTAYSNLHNESIPKINNDSLMWCKMMFIDQKEFGKFISRKLKNIEFTSRLENFETGQYKSGFFVFIEYITKYINIDNIITELIVLQQNDYRKWKILSYSTTWESSSEGEK